jgi:cysteinyl-tRNA synthetase
VALRLYNSLTRREEEFAPADGRTVNLYTCGPTVYNVVHIGNLRTFLFEDLLCRYLHYLGYEVRQVMNLTDVDDKTILGAQSEGLSLADFTRKYADLFFEDLDALGIQPAWKYPRATEFIPQMLALIQTLIDTGHAYVTEDGSVYFDISSFPQYGRLSGVKPEEAEEARQYGRLQADEYEREQVTDFALWKATKPGEPCWPSPWGEGRPGWHIECSAMAMHLFDGTTLDIHAGAVDLLFPHHENEIAQSEAATGKLLARFWLHAEHLIVNGHKMSKSLGNFFTLRDLTGQGFNAKAVRHQLMSAHYRKQLNFTLKSLGASKSAVERVQVFAYQLPQMVLRTGTPGTADDDANRMAEDAVRSARERFQACMDDDLNVPGAMGVVFDLIKQVRELIDAKTFFAEGRNQVMSFLRDTDQVLGLLPGVILLKTHFTEGGTLTAEGVLVDPIAEIDALVAERTAARAEKNWARADEIRDELAARGIVIEDTSGGTIWRRG